MCSKSNPSLKELRKILADVSRCETVSGFGESKNYFPLHKERDASDHFDGHSVNAGV